jgi:polyisoprenoid-binding protein YceI
MTTIQTSTGLPHGVDLPAPGTYEIDASHSTVGVVARHLMVSKVRGRFSDVSGTVTIAEDAIASSTGVVIGAASIDTREAKRDEHLRSADFLDVERFPQLAFTSTALDHVHGNRWRLAGDLTIKGISRPVTFDVEFLGNAKDPWGGDRIAFEAKGELDREDWDITWNVALEAGGVLVSKKLTFELEIQAVKQS